MPRVEKLASIAAVLFLVAVFGVGLYNDVTRKPVVWEAKVFEVVNKGDTVTYVYSYGNGFRVFEGTTKITVEAEHTYKFTYNELSNGRARIISVTEVK